MDEEYVPRLSFIIDGDLREVKRIATRFCRFQYYMAAHSPAKWTLTPLTLFHDWSPHMLEPPRCTVPYLIPGGRFVLTATTGRHNSVLCWDLFQQHPMHRNKIKPSAEVELQDAEVNPETPASLNAQFDPTSSSVNVTLTRRGVGRYLIAIGPAVPPAYEVTLS